MELTPEQRSSIAKFNSLGVEITDNMMMSFMEKWFTNIRTLLRSDFTPKCIKLIIEDLQAKYKSFICLGSGPSITEIARNLPQSHGAILCGPTAIGALLRENVRPTAIVVADHSIDQYYHILESGIDHPETLDVILPITADPAWYGSESILSRDHLFFYLNYLTFEGDTNLGYNVILKALFPEVPWYITQAGSVANTLLNVADWCCGEDPEARVYVGFDSSWIKGRVVRAPLRYDARNESMKLWKENNYKVPENTVDISWVNGEIIQTDLISLTYAVQTFYLIHVWWRDFEYKKNRFCLIREASKLYQAVASDVHIPIWFPEGHYLKFTAYEDSWAYKVMLRLIETANTLRGRLIKEANDAEESKH